MTYKFTIDGRFYGKNTFPDLNNYISECSKHPKCGGRMKKDFMTIASGFIRKQIGRKKIQGKVAIHYRYYEASRRRDPSNVSSFAVKVIEDALQACGVLEDDGWNNIQGYSQDFFIDKRNPRIEVYIKEVS